MVKRRFWLKKIEEAWQKRSVIWLSGVRRVGKTFLCKSISEAEYLDCELPSVRRLLEDPESFFKDLRGRRIILDEIHRLPNPSELLKIAADHYPDIKVIATGSSTLGASKKFRDTLLGRKAELWLTPVTLEDMKDFKNLDIKHRFLSGGLPPFFLSTQLTERDFQEWLDAYWAKDITELFRLERRYSFLRFSELLFGQSGGIFEATRFSRPCEVSRTTISNYLSVLEATYLAHVIRPFSTYKPVEIISAPRVYAFDTGFVCHYRGWDKLRQEDLGYLWEHFVLNELFALLQRRDIRYWRDKQGHEIDFIIVKGSVPIAVECKWKAEEFGIKNLKVFRRLYPEGENIVVTADVTRTYTREYEGIKIRFLNLEHLKDYLLNLVK
ncbi:MAG: ATP-binding protein [Thermodesulfovibrionia bacterium]